MNIYNFSVNYNVLYTNYNLKKQNILFYFTYIVL